LKRLLPLGRFPIPTPFLRGDHGNAAAFREPFSLSIERGHSIIRPLGQLHQLARLTKQMQDARNPAFVGLCPGPSADPAA